MSETKNRAGETSAARTLQALRARASERGRLRYLEKFIPLLLQRRREIRQEIYGGVLGLSDEEMAALKDKKVI